MFRKNKNEINTIDEELYELSQMLIMDKEDPIFNVDCFDKKELDYSIRSLNEIEKYLNFIKKMDIFNSSFNKVVLRVGAYVGEVIKKFSANEYHWYDYETTIKLNKKIRKYGKQVGTVAILYSDVTKELLFPINKVCKYIECGSVDSLVVYVQYYIKDSDFLVK